MLCCASAFVLCFRCSAESPSTPLDSGRPKRERKSVTPFSSASFEKEKPSSAPLTIQKGAGRRLRDIENVEHRIALTRTTAPPLILLHRILFPAHKGHPTKTTIKGHIRDFSGWTGDGDEDEARKRMDKKEVKELRQIAQLLDVSGTGSKAQLIDHISAFCQKPSSSGHAFKSQKSQKGKGKKGGSGKKGKGKGKKKGGGGGMNAYMVFVKERREKGEGEGMSVAEFGKKMGEEWRGLDDDEKAQYKKKADQLKAEGGGGGGGEGEDEEDGEGAEEEEDEDGEEGEGEEGEDGEDEHEEGEGAEAGDGEKAGQKKKGSGKKEEEGDDEAGLDEEHRSILDKLRGSISAILKGADLEALSVKKVKEQLTLEHGEELINRFAKNIKAIVTKAVQGPAAAEDKDS